MQCVILAAGRGTRMNELTTAIPKPMLEVAGKPLLEYKIEALPSEVEEVVLIVGYKSEVVREHFGQRYGEKRIRYVEQKELNGTAGALWAAKELLKERFLVMMGDDIYHKEDVAECVSKTETWALLVQQLPTMGRAGYVVLGEDGNIADIIESSKEDDVRTGSGIASTNLYVLDARLFSCPLVPKHEGSLEYGLPQTVVAAAKQLKLVFEPVYTTRWIQITAPRDLMTAADLLKKFNKKAT